MVEISDLSTHFDLSNREVIRRINSLCEEGLLNGVIDERGRFLYITIEEEEV